MINYLKKIIKKNKKLFNIAKSIKMSCTLMFVSALKLLNTIRKESCDKDDIRCGYDIKNINYNYTLFGKDTPICCLTHLYEITRDITKVLNTSKIDYFIMYGTLLGQVRHNQTFIPWDTDVDIAVMEKDRERVVTLLKDKFSNIYNLVEDEKILKINFSDSNQLHADIYFWEEKDGVLVDTLNDYWVKNRVKKSDAFPLRMSKLYDLDIKVPSNSVKVLKDTYGDDCLDKAFKKYVSKQENVDDFKSAKIDKKYLKRV